MGSGYFLDSNFLVDLIQNNLNGELSENLFSSEVYSNDIVRIEVLGFEMDKTLESAFKQLFEILKILPLSEEIVLQTIQIRKQKKIKLGDALIAATAIVHNLKLVTRNVRDFKGIEGLDVVNSNPA
jgi:predicted nucleic acid-binding protein